MVVAVYGNQCSDNDMGYGHGHRACKEKLSPAHYIHSEYTACYTNQLENIENTGHDKLHARVEAHVGKKGRRVVDQGIDSHKLDAVSLPDEHGVNEALSLLVGKSSS